MIVVLTLLMLAAAGCARVEPAWNISRPTDRRTAPVPLPAIASPVAASPVTASPATASPVVASPVAASSDSREGSAAAVAPSTGAVIAAAAVLQTEPAVEEIQAGQPIDVLQLQQVVDSVQRSYPLLQVALLDRDAALGEHLAAHGAFDLKLKGASENGPVGFYETYRQNIGVEQPTRWGGALFGGYRIGRGTFQPWYGERQTDDGGEFRAGVAVPLARNIEIDARRAELWRTDLGRQLVEPEIRLQLIDFVRAASYSYWDWVAAGRRYEIAASLLEMAEKRNEAIRRKVEAGDSEPPVLQDNRRIIVSREAKLIEAERKRQQAAIKLSLFYRNERGEPQVAELAQLPGFPSPDKVDEQTLAADTQAALENRPELVALNLQREQLQIDLAEARNDLLPNLDAVMTSSQDVGPPASSKQDKSEYELEAGLFLDVPVQRRKAQGKITTVESKLRQLVAKRRMTADKISTEVQAVYAARLAAFQQIQRARESAELADRLAETERRKFELGESDLLSVNLREQQAAEAQLAEVDAMYEYFTALADYRAILALD